MRGVFQRVKSPYQSSSQVLLPTIREPVKSKGARTRSLKFAALFSVTVAIGLVAPLIIPNFVDSAIAASCPTTEQSSIVTKKGSKDVRKELNRLNNDLACRHESFTKQLEQWRKAEEASYKRAVADFNLQKRLLRDCITYLKLTETQYEKKYKPISNPKAPCAGYWWGSFSSPLPPSKVPGQGLPVFKAYEAMLRSGIALYQLAKIYPDSVQPSRLPGIIQLGEAFSECLRTKSWCWTK
jgi:hypothetical protein